MVVACNADCEGYRGLLSLSLGVTKCSIFRESAIVFGHANYSNKVRLRTFRVALSALNTGIAVMN
jgi:hypothetical protein